MVKSRKILLLFLTVMLIKIPFLSVYSAENEEHIENIIYKTNINTVTASVNVTANNKKRILVLSTYKNGCLQKIAADSKIVNGTEKLKVSIDKTDADEVAATVIDAFGGNLLTKKAVYGADSTSLEYIKVNGEAIEYDDETDEYWIQYSKEPVDIDFSVKDGTTQAIVSDYKVPGNAEIKVISSSKNIRNIILHLYRTEEDLIKLSGMKYKIGKTIYEVDGFSPDKKQYSIVLEDNVMGVTLLPQAVSDVSCTISNICVKTIDGISLGTMVGSSETAYQYTHNSRNNYIPIKNEKTTAYVTVKSEDKSTQYQFDFISKQPRLTSFEYVGAENDSPKPVFIGGSAVNNDYGTILSMDRRWAIGNISKALLGGSCFMLPASNKDSNWWNENTSGEYFNFTADTKGTVYVLSGNSISNSEYGSWTTGSNSASPPSGQSWLSVSKDWNDYSAEYFAYAIEHMDDYQRAQNPGIAETDEYSELNSAPIGNYAYRTFEAGEKVSIYHTGTKGQNATKAMVIIIWDGVLGAEEEEDKEPTTEPNPIEIIEDEDKVMSLVFDAETETTENVWRDNSGYHNDVNLYVDDNNKWTENGFMVTGGSEQSTKLPDAVNDAINSNVFTIQFELLELNPVSGKKCSILSSENENFEIYKSNTNAYVYFKWAGNTTALKMPKVTDTQMTGHLNTIVVDKNEEGTDQIKWYIDGTLIVSKSMNATDKTVDKVWLSTPNNTYDGNVVFRSLVVYKKALSLEEITGGSTE